MGHGFFLSHFPISHASWLLPIVFELLCRSLLREQCQNPWFSVEWRVEMSWKCWSNLKNGRPAALVTFERMEATIPLFISENKTWLGFSCSSYRAHPLSASVSDFMGPTDKLSSAIQVLGWSILGLQLFSSINPIVFRPNSYIISIFRAMALCGFTLGLWTVPRLSHNRLRWFIRCCIRYFSGLGLLG